MTATTAVSASPGATRPLPRLAAKGAGLWLAVSLATLVVVAAPIGGLVYFALRGAGDLWPHLVSFVLPEALRQTGILLAGVGIVVTVIGVGTAWLVANCRFPGRRFFEWALLLPLAVPTYIVAYSYLDVAHPIGPVQTFLRGALGIASPRDLWFPEVRSMGGCIFLLSFVLYPYVYLPVRALFLMQSAAMTEAARTLGAGGGRAFLRVGLPLARPAIAIGVTLALMEALNDIGASQFLGVRTLTVSIYSTWVTRSSIGGAAQIALVMLVLILALILLERWARRHQRYSGQARNHRQLAPAPLGRLGAAGAIAACGLPILFGFVVPATYLAHQAIQRIAEFGLPRDLGVWISNSLGFAAIATAIAVGLGLVLAYTVRLAARPHAFLIVRLASIGYAIPGTVLAVGLLVPLGAFDNALDGWMRSAFGVSTGLLLSGSGAALVVAYVIRFLAISAGDVEAGMAKVSPSLDMAARSLGAGAARTLARVHVPIMRPAIAAAALLVFVDCMKELPATLLLRPFNFETLATFLYGEAVRGTHENGAVAALMIVLVGLVPVILLARANLRFEPKTGASASPMLAAGN